MNDTARSDPRSPLLRCPVLRCPVLRCPGAAIRRHGVAAAAAVVLATLSLVASAGPSSASEPDGTPVVVHEPPVAGRVMRGFEAPGRFASAGHRGVDLAATAGDPVFASADGIVTFAGDVAGERWVSIAHADGTVTSLGPLDTVRVGSGAPVDRGDPVGRMGRGAHAEGSGGAGLHWSARRAGMYIDPLDLLEAVPRPSLVAPGGWVGTHHVVTPYEPWEGSSFFGMLASSSPDATRPGYATPPNANHLVVIPGLATSSSSEVIDPSHLGYDPRSVSRFSYAGLDDPRTLTNVPYGPADTWQGAEPAARALAEHLAAVNDAQPGRAVDILAHSMGGIVAIRYLLEHHDAYDLDLPGIANIVTFNTPFRGSDIASVGGVLVDDPALGDDLVALQRLTGVGLDHLSLDAPAISELAVGSEALDDLAARWEDGWARSAEELPTGPMAMRPRVLTIGGSRDLVVPPERAAQPSGPWYGAVGDVERVIDGRMAATHRVLPGGHSGVLGSEAAREVAYDFLSGKRPTQSPGRLSSVLGRGLGTIARMGVAAVEWLREDRFGW